jgi:hypothetical protein
MTALSSAEETVAPREGITGSSAGSEEDLTIYMRRKDC